jgi:hypothetical protein
MPPLQLPVQPGVGPPALLCAQDAAADEDAQGHTQATISVGTMAMLCVNAQDSGSADQRGRRRPDRPAADPQLVGGQAAHDNGLAVQPVRKERDQRVRTDVLRGDGHTLASPYSTPVAFGEQPDADHEQDRAPIGDREAELAPGGLRPVWISA